MSDNKFFKILFIIISVLTVISFSVYIPIYLNSVDSGFFTTFLLPLIFIASAAIIIVNKAVQVFRPKSIKIHMVSNAITIVLLTASTFLILNTLGEYSDLVSPATFVLVAFLIVNILHDFHSFFSRED